jgi:hypothetical protein
MSENEAEIDLLFNQQVGWLVLLMRRGTPRWQIEQMQTDGRLLPGVWLKAAEVHNDGMKRKRPIKKSKSSTHAGHSGEALDRKE